MFWLPGARKDRRRAWSALLILAWTAAWSSAAPGQETAVLVKDINTTGADSSPRSLANVTGTLFFAASDPIHGVELWKSDGTTAGTVRVKDINPIPRQGSPPNHLTDVNVTLFFSASDPVHGEELWKSDGTEAGTVLVKDIWPGPSGSVIQ